jgi:hypothetical protein
MTRWIPVEEDEEEKTKGGKRTVRGGVQGAFGVVMEVVKRGQRRLSNAKRKQAANEEVVETRQNERDARVDK